MTTGERQSIASATEKRILEHTHELDHEIIARVAEIADATHDLDVAKIMREIEPASVTTLHYGESASAVVLNVRSNQPLEDHRALVVCLPVAATHSEYQLMRTALLVRLFPGRRIVVVANVDGTEAGPVLRSSADRVRVANGDFRPLAAPVLRYLYDTGVESISLLGCSFGAELASRLAALAPECGITVDHLVAVEPPGIIRRTVAELAGRFALCSPQAQPEIRRRVISTAYRSALQREVKFLRTARSVVVRDNRAVARGIARGQFSAWLGLALERNPNMAALLASTEGSLLSPAHIIRALAAAHGRRVRAISLGPFGHEVCTDAALVGALLAQALGSDSLEA